ncbi:hypothetical protein [Kytococcus sp. Marseille-QA3725]
MCPSPSRRHPTRRRCRRAPPGAEPRRHRPGDRWRALQRARGPLSGLNSSPNLLLNTTAGTVLQTLGSHSNLDETTDCTSRSYDLSAHAGDTATLRFTSTEDKANQTSFLIDDVALHG